MNRGETGFLDDTVSTSNRTDTTKLSLLDQEALHSYSLRPKIQQKFKPNDVKELIHGILMARLADKTYNTETSTELAKSVSADIKEKLKQMNYDRYKFIIQCVIGEQKGAGMNMSGRCFWDSDTDNFAESIYTNDTIFCVAAVYGVYHY
jgi:hypothetical protein